jgi:hypothetical protein
MAAENKGGEERRGEERRGLGSWKGREKGGRERKI